MITNCRYFGVKNVVGLAALTLGLQAVEAGAQTSETLLSILQQQGVLTPAQVEQVRRDAVKAETKAAKPEAPTAGAAPLSLRLSGELRLRYEGFFSDNPAFIDRNRFRFRLRVGGVADVAKNVEVGFRLTTGVAEGEPTGNNSTLQDNASKKAIAIDLAYAKWTPLKTKETTFAVLGGKMNIPFTSSDLVFDGDYTPEGAAIQFSHALTADHTLRANAAEFVLDELSASSHDPFLTGLQVRLDSTWSQGWTSTVGLTWVDVSNASRLVNSAVPDIHKGNTRTAAGGLVHDYHPYVIDAGFTRSLESFPGYPGAFPIRIAGDYMTNPGADSENHAYYAGLYAGKAGKKGTWEFNYRYRVMEADAWYEELADSDSGAFYQTAPAGGSTGYGGGTNVRGHIFAGNYALTDYALIGFTLFDMELINPTPSGSESGSRRLQVNTLLKF